MSQTESPPTTDASINNKPFQKATMKRMIISAAACLAVLASIAEEKAFLCVSVRESGQLEDALGDRINSID